ncbi:MAG: endolytic transglycosylase MltG [Kovacikia sp.]
MKVAKNLPSKTTQHPRQQPTPKRSKGSVIWLLVLAALGISAWQGWQWWSWASAAPAPAGTTVPAKAVNLQISQGTSAQEIGKDLEALGVIRSATAWNLWTRWLMFSEPQGGFQAGIYQISAAQPMAEIAAKIWTGDVVHAKFTIPEGWSLKQMAAYFEKQGFFPAQDFLNAAHQFPLEQYSWLPRGSTTALHRLEGFLFPDTYQVAGSPTPEAILKQMLDRFEQAAVPLYQQRSTKSSLSFAEWVTLASIVEKEAVIPQERSLIAGVFLNRLRKSIPLGADPTVEYALGIQQTPDNPLTLEQVRTASPYNTYLNSGLPPTPIASPGIASLKAVLYPENTDYLYFVARYDGTHIFSRTLKDHQSAQTQIHDKLDASKSAKP